MQELQQDLAAQRHQWSRTVTRRASLRRHPQLSANQHPPALLGQAVPSHTSSLESWAALCNSLLSFCTYSKDCRVYVHDPVQEPLRLFLPLLTSLSQSMALNPVFVLEAEPLEDPQATALPKVAQAKCKSLLTDYFSVYFQLASQKPGNPTANLSYT